MPVRAATTLPAELWKTGQTTCYDYPAGSAIACPGTGQDGDWLAGVPWPSPRFTDNSNGTATDNLTGLIWLKNADCFSVQTWANALNSANTLNSGECGLSDSSVEGDWRLPNTIELRSISDYSQAYPGLPSGHPFTNVQSSFPSFYWSSSTYAANPGSAFIVNHWEAGGDVGVGVKTGSHYVWPVRGGHTPNAFTFTDVTGVPLSTVQTSDTITVGGITAPAAITIVGGEYQVNGAGPWTSSAGTVANTNTVRVRHTSSATNSTAVNTTLTIGGVSDTFTSTTLADGNGPDLTGTWDPVSQICRRGRCMLRGSVRIWNQGNKPAPTSSLRVILSDDAVMGPGDTVLHVSSIGRLRPGQSRTRPINVPLPLGVTASGKYLFAVVDALNGVAETNETNNTPMYGPIP